MGHSDASSRTIVEAGGAKGGQFDTRLASDRAKAERDLDAMPEELKVEQILISVRRVGPAETSLVELVTLNTGLGLRIKNDAGQEGLSAIAENDPLEAVWSHPALHRIDPQRQTEFEIDPACNLTEAAIAQTLVVGHDTHPADSDEIDDLPPRATGAVVVINGQTWVELDSDPPIFVQWTFSDIVYDEPWAEFSYDVPSSGSTPYRSSIGIAGGMLIVFVAQNLDDAAAVEFIPDGGRRLAVLGKWLLDLDRRFPSADGDHVLLTVSVNVNDSRTRGLAADEVSPEP